MNKNRNKVAAMMMVAAITVSSVAMPVEAAVSSIESVGIERRKENKVNDIQVTSDLFPDENFRKYILTKFGDTISEEEINKTDTMFVDRYGIVSLEGIGVFKNLKTLNCIYNKIEILDLHELENLTTLYCEENIIRELILPNSIKELNCQNTRITELKLNNLSELVELQCHNTFLKELDLSNNKKIVDVTAGGCKFLETIKLPEKNETLEILSLMGNKKLKEINLSGLSRLTSFILTEGELEKIDLPDSENLTILDLSNNKLKTIDLSKNKNLKDLDLSSNELKTIDLSSNAEIRNLELSSNKLRDLDLSNQKYLEKFSMNNIDNNEIGKLKLNKSIPVKTNLSQTINFLVKNNQEYIDLETEFGITKNDIKNVSLITPKNISIDGTKIRWKDEIPEKIEYKYDCEGIVDDIKLNVELILYKNENPEQGGGSGGGTTTPDQKPDQKPDEKPNKPNKPGNITSKIVGKNRYETAAKIADELVKNNVSYNSVILVNSDKSMADGLSAASLSGKKNAPILLVKKDSIPAETMAKIEKAKNVYIIGGEGAISKKVENQLKGKNITRISGKDRYETSAKIANMLGGYKMAFIVNGAKGEADAMSVSSVAAKYGAPILLTNGKTSTHPVKEGVSYFVIGGRGVVSNQLADKYNADRIAGVDRYSTNRKVIDEFYYDSKKVYFAKGDTLVDALTASLLAKDNGMVLVSKNANHKKLEGKEAVQAGGMDFEISFE